MRIEDGGGLVPICADFATTWLPLAFFAILVLTAWLLWKTVGMMPRVKPAAPRLEHRSRSVTWADVAGVEEVRAELMEVVDFLREPKRFERLGAKVPKGLLLYGPPGPARRCSRRPSRTSRARTSTPRARRRSSRCSPASAPRASASSSPRRARTRRRSSSSTSSTPSARSAAGTASTASRIRRSTSCSSSSTASRVREQVVVMGASNRIQDLDQALLRPGRFDRQMLVPPPDLKGREAILAVHTRGKPLAPDVDLGAGRAPDQRSHRRRAREHLQRGGDLRRPPRRRSHLPVRLRQCARARRRRAAAEEGADREGAPHPRLPRGRPRADGAPDGRGDGAAEGDDRLARRARSATRSTCPRRTATSTRRRSSSTG